MNSAQPLMRLACLAAVVLLASQGAAGELQWRKVEPKKFKPTSKSQPIAKQSNFTPPVAAQPRHDGSVRVVAFEADGRGEFDGPAFGAKQAASEELRSVVVEGDHLSHHADQDIRSAQLQSDTNDRYNQQITEPFGQPPAAGESTEVELNEEEITLPEDNMSEPAPPADMSAPPADTNRQPATTGREPRSFQPAPARNTPRPDPFVESDEARNDGLPNTEDPTLADEGARAQADCAKELAALKGHTLDQVNLSIAITGNAGQDFPVECSIDDGAWHEGRCWDETTFMWKASALCHKPLYFENEQLERYGHSWGPCLDPVMSGAHFFATLPVLPYCMGVHPPNECMYTLGHYRPGNCAPYMISPVPISCRGAIFQAGAVVGAAAILP